MILSQCARREIEERKKVSRVLEQLKSGKETIVQIWIEPVNSMISSSSKRT